MATLGRIKPRNFDTSGDYVANSMNIAGNVSAGNIKTNNLLYANGTAYVFTTNAAGSNTEIQFNNNNSFAGSANLTFNNTTNTLSVTNIAVTDITTTGVANLGNVANIKIAGGSNTQLLTTDGNGNLSWTSQVSLSGYATETYVGNAIANLVNSAPATLDTLSELSNALANDASYSTTITNALANKLSTSDFISTANNWGANYLPNHTGNISANYFIGNGSSLTNIAGANVTGFVSNADIANTAYAVSGSNVSGQVGNAIVAGTVYTNAQPNITSVGNLTSLDVTGNVSATFFIGNGSQLTGLPASYTDSNVANYLPNYSGNISAGNANLGNSVTANFFVGNGSLLTGLPASYSNNDVANYLPNYTGNVSANYFIGNGSQLTGISISTASAVTTNSQPNITSVGTLTSLDVSGNVSFTGANVSLGNVSNLKILGGTANYILTTDGTGNLVWTEKDAVGIAVTLDTFTGNGVATSYTLSRAPIDENHIVVNIDGVIQLKSAYSVSGTTLTFTSAPDNNTPIEVQIIAFVGAAANVNFWSYTGNGVQTAFSISSTATATTILVTENGILQMPTVDYTVSSSNINFVTAPANNVAIQIREIPSVTTASALTAQTVINNAQPNITSVGTLTSLTVSGDVTANNFIGNGSQLTGISAGVSNARVVGYNLVFGG